jgi:hypothetical protein
LYMLEHEHHKIEDIKQRLYDKDDTEIDTLHPGALHKEHFYAPELWKTEIKNNDSTHTSTTTSPKAHRFVKKFFIAASIFFVCALGFALFMYTKGGVSVSNEKIDITVLGNAFTKGGEELPLQIEISNRNTSALELADLLIEYPRGASDLSTDVIRIPRDSIGTIGRGARVTRLVKVALFGQEKSIRPVRISLEYHPEGSNAIFTKTKEYPVTISSAPVSLRIEAPTQVTSDQSISLVITATLNTTLPSTGAMVQVQYPPNFVYEGAVPDPVVGNALWSMESLTKENPLVITIKGKVIGQDKDEQVVHVYAGTTDAHDASRVQVLYTSLLHTLTIAKPFLDARIVIGGKDIPVYAVVGGDTVNAEVTWVNNLQSRITNAEIRVRLSGNAFDKTAVNSLEGFYDSALSQILWDKNTISELASIEPGQSGSFAFSFKPLMLSGGASSLKDPQVALDVSMQGSQSALGGTINTVSNVGKKIVKLASDFQIAAQGTSLSGPVPPKVEGETRYTISWNLSNSANTINQAQARASLPSYIRWEGKSTGVTEDISYNQATREVLWNIGTVRPRVGFGASREASFVVVLKPSLSQVGSVPQLTKSLFLSGTDAFTGTVVKATRNPVTTASTEGSQGQSSAGRVVE